MTFEEFESYQNLLLIKVVNMKNTKGKEYANSNSRFASFDAGAEELGIDRLVVAMIFCDKHIRALKSYIRNKETFSTEHIEGRIVDIITYMILIAGMIYEDEHPRK